MIRYLFTKVFLIFCLILSFMVTLWKKTRFVRSFFYFPQCRFYPSCSDYFLESVKMHGLVSGLILSIKRLIRCHPLCNGGVDLVPSPQPEGFVWFSARGGPAFGWILHPIMQEESTKGSSSLS